MQTGQPSSVYPENAQGQNQHAFSVLQPDFGAPTFPLSFGTKPPINQNPRNLPSNPQSHLHNCTTTLPQCGPDQFHGCPSCAAPIFIIPGGCQVPQQLTTPVSNYGQAPFPASYPTSFPMSCPMSCPTSSPSLYQATMPMQQTVPPNQQPQSACWPPSFYPFPVPMPMYPPDAFSGQGRVKEMQCCDCLRKSSDPADVGVYPGSLCCQSGEHRDEHRCTHTNDGTVCSKRNCPLSISLQALSAQLLSMQGILPCAAVRLILRKVPGSNVTTSVEDTMERAQNSINTLTKDQLLAESRYAQQVNALINLHMTANPPLSLIPILSLIQLKVNVLKAHVESLISKKVMENQGVEVEATHSFEPAVLALKTDNELREFLTLLRQKECNERVNLNFSPYRSQRVIAEMRLKNVQNKILQIEEEFNRRRCTVVPGHSLSYRTVPQYSDVPANLSGFCDSTFNDLRTLLVSPDPFAAGHGSPKRLILRPHVGSPETTYDQTWIKATPNVQFDCSFVRQNVKNTNNQNEGPTKTPTNDAECQDDRSQNQNEAERKDHLENDERKNKDQGCRKYRQDDCDSSSSLSSIESSSCDESSTDENLTEEKKKLRASFDKRRDGFVNGEVRLKDAHRKKQYRKKRSTEKKDGTCARWSSEQFKYSFPTKEMVATGDVSSDDVSENRKFATCTFVKLKRRKEINGGLNDVRSLARNKLIEENEKEGKIATSMTGNSSKQKDDVEGNNSSRLSFSAEKPTEDVLASKSDESRETTSKFVKVELINDPDEETHVFSRDAEAQRKTVTDAEGEKPEKSRFVTTKTMFIGDPGSKLKNLLKVKRSSKERDTSLKVTEDIKSADDQAKQEKAGKSVALPSGQTTGKQKVKTELFVKLDTRKRTDGREKPRQDVGQYTQRADSIEQDERWTIQKKTVNGMEEENPGTGSSDEEPRKDVYTCKWSVKTDSSKQGAKTKIVKPFGKTLPTYMSRDS